MKILNLYACLGGNRYKWDEVSDGLEITAVEIDPELARLYQERFPNDKVVIADAHQYLLDHYKEFDFIWSSPPCPTHSRMIKATRHDVVCYPDMKLYEEIILLQNFFDGKFVVENVMSYYDPLIKPYVSTRHYYWSNFKIVPCLDVPKIKNMSTATRAQMAEYLGFDYEGKNIYIKGNHDPAQVLRNCAHPNEGKYLLETALNITRANQTNQTTLFK